MWRVNKKDLYNFLILVSLFHGIRGEFGGVKQKAEREIAFEARFIYNFGETSGETAITPAITVDDENVDVNEPKNLFVQNFKRFDNAAHGNKDLIAEKIYTAGREEFMVDKSSVFNVSQRRVRDAEPEQKKNYNLECYQCDGTSGSQEEKYCYNGTIKSTRSCQEAAQCYIDFNPQYITRGCLLPEQMNRTFYCKCPLCNNKPADDHSYFTYRSIRDWEFDNHKLQTAIEDVSLLCLSCETDGLNMTNDKLCRAGEKATISVCERNSACYTNINDETGQVSRGCISLPVYNSIHFFCNQSLCNGGAFKTPIERRQSEHPIIQRLYHGKQRVYENSDEEEKITQFTSSKSSKSYSIIVCGNLLLVTASVIVSIGYLLRL